MRGIVEDPRDGLHLELGEGRRRMGTWLSVAIGGVEVGNREFLSWCQWRSDKRIEWAQCPLTQRSYHKRFILGAVCLLWIGTNTPIWNFREWSSLQELMFTKKMIKYYLAIPDCGKLINSKKGIRDRTFSNRWWFVMYLLFCFEWRRSVFAK